MMRWWRRLRRDTEALSWSFDPSQLTMHGWSLVNKEVSTAYWHDGVGDVISLTLTPPVQSLPSLSDTDELRKYCRRSAERQAAGLVEVRSTIGAAGPSLTYIYKRLEVPALTYYGVLSTPFDGGMWRWMILAYERGTTGVREATVTSRLFEAHELTLETYEATWAQDPYDPSYRGVDRSTLRYRSDTEEYDDEFPDHPLSKVRRELRRLLTIGLPSGTAT